MCGICGATSREIRNKDALVSAVSAMNAAQARRGPDDEGAWADEKNATVFGQRRLSIIDLSPDGHQPMQYEHFHITFNGEIYNFEEIKKELLQKGYQFKTKSDTEVILVAYKEWGVSAFSKLRGMFAFALYDDRTDKMVLVRDRYGIKPLYYAKTDKGLVFASTVDAIKKSGTVNATENKDAKIYFLTFGSVPLPYTTYNEITSIRAGHFLEINSHGSATEKKYYDSFSPFLTKVKDSRDEAAKKIKEILTESVRLHLISDAPIGVFLSGGLDSSALSAIASELRNEPVSTLGIDFEEKEFSEKKYRDEVVSKIKSHHKEIVVTQKDFEEEKDNIFEAMDQPSIDGVNTYFVSRAAKRAGLKVVLSGLGSDEIFMGYHYFKKIKQIRFIQKWIPQFSFSLLPKKGKLSRLRWLKNKHPFFAYTALRGIFSPSEIADLLQIDECEVWSAVEKLLSNLPAQKELERLSAPDLQSYFELNFYMANQLLKDTDFMSMYHSIEVRVPFLDHVLVEYVSSLPAEIKLVGKHPKQLLIDAVSDLLSSSVWERPKMGFTFPFAEWMKEANPSFNTKMHWSRFWSSVVLNHWK